ncbi:MAG: hypothetical protein H6Q66_1516 [Firmicutes bacterium]|nr:hypothetical protein [Bacillota bacterium]
MKWFRKLIGALVLLVMQSGAVCLAGNGNLLPGDLLKAPEWPVTMTSFGGRLLLSDSPEIVPGDGVMYQDTVNGRARLFFHHVNGTMEPKKIVALLVNDGDTAAHVTVNQHGVAGPGGDYLAVGKAAQQEYLAAGELYLLDVPPRGTALLAPVLNVVSVEPNMLLNGIYDFQTDRPLTVKMMMMPLAANVDEMAFKLAVLPKDRYRLRGTFDGPDRLLMPDKAYDGERDGPVAFTLADNQIDLYQKGIDATDGSQTVNYGNYGVVYHMYIPSAHHGNLQVLLNPLGGEFAGAMGVKYNYTVSDPRPVPADKLFFGRNPQPQLASIGIFAGGRSLWLTFSPPGASNLPVRLLIVPN